MKQPISLGSGTNRKFEETCVNRQHGPAFSPCSLRKAYALSETV
jgi:hypothetical protein